MLTDKSDQKVSLDLNCPEFQDSFFKLEKTDRLAVTETLKIIRLLTWSQVYRDHGLKLEKIISIQPTAGLQAINSFRISQSRRAIAARVGNEMRLLLISPDHDSTYCKNSSILFIPFLTISVGCSELGRFSQNGLRF